MIYQGVIRLNELTNEICFEISEMCKIDIGMVLKNSKKSFFDEPFNLTPELLVYFYFLIKNKYKLRLSKKELLDYAFLNIENLCRTIENNI